MSGSSRKRSSQWDLKEDSRAPFESVQDSSWPGKGVPLHDKESQRGWVSAKANGGNRAKWSEMEPLPRRRGSRRDDSMDEDHGRPMKAMTPYDDENYGTRMSPGLDDTTQLWAQHNSHRSPKRSRRSRSRSRSPGRNWSRSRSKSPSNGIRRESGAYARSRSRSGVPDQLCKDFAVGRCRRGNHCHFLHEGTRSYEDGWERDRKTLGSKYSVPRDSREYYSIVDEAGSRSARHGVSDVPSRGFTSEVIRERDNDRRHRHESPERRSERGTRKVDVPCKFFAAGNCRNGDHCRFTHSSQTRESPDRRSRDVRWTTGQNSNDVEKFWDGPRWDDNNTSSDATKLCEDKSEKMDAPDARLNTKPRVDGWDQSLDVNKRCRDSPFNNMAEDDKKEALHWRAGNAVDKMHVPEQRASENWLGDTEMSPDWKYRVQPSNRIDKGEHSPLPISEPSITQEVPSQTHAAAAAAMAPMINELPSIQQNFRMTGICGLPSNESLIGKTDSSGINTSPCILGPESFNQNGLNSNSLPLSSINRVAQSEVAILTDPSRVVGMINTQNQAPFPEGNAIKQDIVDANISQLKSGNPTAQNNVSSEEFTRLTTLSASLAQLLANGHQLPQLYVAHNINNSVNNSPSFANPKDHVKLDSAVNIQPGQVVGTQKQYDPVCDSLGPGKHGASDSLGPEKHSAINNPSNFSPNLIRQKSNADPKPELLPKHLSPSSLGSAPSNGVYKKLNSVEEVPTDKVFQLNQLEAGVNSEVTKENHGVRPEKNRKGSEESRKALEQNQTAQDDVPLEEFDGDGKAYEGKKSKDAKGIRAFKFALVESVKELLKPAWKEGQIDKDAYKNIVKKVVDKVTGTMQGANIPQTQEKIEQYLSVSKPKITKLIQAYVEKFQKDK